MIKMNLIFILSLLLIITGFTESHDLNCFNDYDQEMVCKFRTSENKCSEYKLNVSRETTSKKFFTCRFEYTSTNHCYCQFEVQDSFIIGEKMNATLLRAEKTLLNKVISTEEIIKPKRPTIVSVNLTANENFRIVLGTNYESPFKKTFVESLIIELYCDVKGSTGSEPIILKGATTEYELVGRNLQPNSNYVVKTRVSTNYNNNQIYSDYSEPYEFSTPSSTKTLLKIIIPILCVILISFIATLFYCYIKIIKQWWDKIPIPKIASSFDKPGPHLRLFPNDFSPVILETSKLVPFSTIMSPAEVAVSPENSLPSVGKGGSSGEVIYAETRLGYGSPDCHSDSTNSQKELGNNSGLSFNNVPYFESKPSDTSSVKQNSCSPMFKNMDLELVPGYQSVDELTDQTDINYHNNVNLIKTKTLPECLQDVTGCENIIMSVDEGYQSFPSLAQNTWNSDHSSEEEENIFNMSCNSQQVHKLSLNSLCDPDLHNLPAMEVDMSYQCV